ncbi:MAG: alkaline phosphatase [Thermoguttaceae bacterium]|nr:alkaline phosphatase [Thermoguttaceae bacterium]
MFKKCLSVFAALAVLVAFSALSQAQEINSPVGAKHVIWIGSDGFGAHYVNWDELPNLKKMKENGAWTLHMRSVLPSSSAINWETQITGAPSESHGYRTWGSKEPDLPPIFIGENGRFPDIFYVIKQAYADAKTSCVYSWDGIGFLYDKACVDVDNSVKSDPEVYETGKAYIADKPTFSFIYFGEPDGTGHSIGWGTPEYQKMLTIIDDYVGKLLADIEAAGIADDTVVIFTADHGGTEKGHGDLLMEHMEVPFLVYGKGVKAGEITDVVVHYDVAATIAWILGAKQPQAWRGQPVKSAFDAQ